MPLGPELNVFFVYWSFKRQRLKSGNWQLWKEKHDEKKKHYYLIFPIQTLWSGFFYCMQLTALNVRSLSSDNGDDNESAKKAIGRGSVYMEVGDPI